MEDKSNNMKITISKLKSDFKFIELTSIIVIIVCSIIIIPMMYFKVEAICYNIVSILKEIIAGCLILCIWSKLGQKMIGLIVCIK